MRPVSNNTIAAFSLFILFISMAFNSYIFLITQPTVGAFTEGSVSMCINKPPVISHSCSLIAYAGSSYLCDINAVQEKGQIVLFSDDTSLFDIDPLTGRISFVPSQDDIGMHNINITAEDNSSCSNSIYSMIFQLDISSAVPAPPAARTEPGLTASRGSSGIMSFGADSLISFSPDSIKILINTGEERLEPIEIVNLHEHPISLMISPSESIGRLVDISDTSFMLEAGEKRLLSIFFKIPEQIPLGVYVGHLFVKGFSSDFYEATHKIPVIIEIESKELLFDASIYISPENRQVIAGQKLTAQITIFSLTGIGAADVDISYIILDMDGTPLAAETETLSISGQKAITKSMDVPDSAEPGDYVFAVQLRHEDSLSTTSQVFSVVSPVEKRIEMPAEFSSAIRRGFIAVILVVLLAVSLAVFFILNSTRSKITELEDKHRERIISRIKQLEETYETEYMKIKELLDDIDFHQLDELEGYLSEMLKKGFKESDIRKHLKDHGWAQQYIQRAFGNLRIKNIEKEIEELNDALRK